MKEKGKERREGEVREDFFMQHGTLLPLQEKEVKILKSL